MFKRFWTDKNGQPCAAKMQNSIVWLITVVKLLLSGVTIAGFTFDTITMDAITPYLALLGVTTTGYAARSYSKEKHK